MIMISAHIMGGLGNQLFQIFNLIAYALKHKIPFFFELQKEENRERPFYWNTFLLSLKGFIKPSEKCKHILKERQYHYEELPEYSLIKKPFKFFGYFQSYKYFYEHQKTIYRFIKLEQQQQKIHKAYNTVYNFNNSISLHFRIGDYKDLQHHHPIMKIEYYVNALELICDHTSKIDWNILYFYEEQDTNEVSNKVNTLKDKFPKMSFIPIDTTIPDYNQLLLMSLCCHNIIANSSFSWWGAYFNFNSDKIVCHPPHKDWFGPAQGDKNLGDLFPHTWVTINENDMAIIQFSPPRSGSTLVYNYLLELGYRPTKEHKYGIYDSKNQYIITIRHPYNSIISSILRYDQDINDKTIEDQIKEYLMNGGEDLITNNFTENNHCILFYENFFKNHDLILNKLELFFNRTYDSELKNKIKCKLEIENVKSTIIKNGYTTFSSYDSKTHFHGKHISEFNGTIDYNKILNKDELNVLEKNKKLSTIIQKYYNQ